MDLRNRNEKSWNFFKKNTYFCAFFVVSGTSRVTVSLHFPYKRPQKISPAAGFFFELAFFFYFPRSVPVRYIFAQILYFNACALTASRDSLMIYIRAKMKSSSEIAKNQIEIWIRIFVQKQS